METLQVPSQLTELTEEEVLRKQLEAANARIQHYMDIQIADCPALYIRDASEISESYGEVFGIDEVPVGTVITGYGCELKPLPEVGVGGIWVALGVLGCLWALKKLT